MPYERFTDRARKVMLFANQEALRCNHEYIGTEHILLGLLKEGSGVAVRVLRNSGIDLRNIRHEVEKLVPSGPHQVPMGRFPHTPRTKRVIEYSTDEAKNLNHDYVGTEHILLGLLREEESVASQVLMNLGLRINEVRKEILNLPRDGLKSLESDAEAYVGRGAVYGDNKKYYLAIADFTEGIRRLKTDFALAYFSRAMAYADIRDYDHAIVDLTEAIRIDPDFAEAYYRRGNTYSIQGEYDLAIADYTEAIRIKPDFIEAYRRREDCYHKKGNYILDSPSFHSFVTQ